MVRLTRIYTRTGDEGKSAFADGTREPKDHPRFEAIGAVDEANAAVGVARVELGPAHAETLARIQNDLFDLGADLARPDEAEGALRVTADQVARLEVEIDKLNEELPPLESFILPGGSTGAAHLHLARTIVRRAERVAVTLSGAERVNPEAIKYLNRLSDHLFVLGRVVNSEDGGDILWEPGRHRGPPEPPLKY